MSRETEDGGVGSNPTKHISSIEEPHLRQERETAVVVRCLREKRN